MSLRTFLLLTCSLVAVMLAESCSPAPSATPAQPSPTTPLPATAGASVGCSAVSAAPTPSGSSLLPPVTSTDYVRGPDAAAVTLLYYCDFQSGQCEIFNRVLDQLVKDHPNDLRVVMRPFPIPVSAVPALDKSELSADAALAAGNQGKFWAIRDLLHAQYNDWANLTPQGFDKWVSGQATDLGLDSARFQRDLASPATRAQDKSLYDAAVGLGISAIPTVFINGGLQQRAALSYDGLESTISLIALGSRQFKACPPFAIDPSKQYTATLHTEKGDIVIKLFADKTPLAVNSFVFLARQGWFDGVTFHRVIPGFVAQGGDPSGTGTGGPGYFFNNEVTPDLLFDKPGMVGMANSGPNTNGSQFFITYASEPQLDGSYTVFGQVIQGMQVVESLTPRDPQQASGLPPGDKILSVTIQEQ
jgi:cyclophilin family peptidyl-prolyl cis-trans isomerase/protein-disulfide isomerase